MDFESWSAVTANHQDLLARLAGHHPTVALSGDVHYGFSTKLTADGERPDHQDRPVHVIGSQELGGQELRDRHVR
ncbi:MAG: hypothetical protein WKF76_10310 [Nocardioidaceae bacterium]